MNAPSTAPELRRVIDLMESGRTVAEVAAMVDPTEQRIYGWWNRHLVDTGRKPGTATITTLKAIIVTANDDLRYDLEPPTDHKLVLACAELDTRGPIADPEVAIRHSIASLARRYLDFHEEIKNPHRSPQFIGVWSVTV